MRNKQHKYSRTKHILLEKKRKGVKRVIWKIEEKDRREYIEKVLHFKVIPFIYEVDTRIFKNVNNLPSVLKKLHYARKEKGKKKQIMKLTKSEIDILKEYEIRTEPIKYEIILK